MEIQFDVTIHITQEFIDHQFMHYEDGYAPSAREVVRSVLEDIDGSHRFAISQYVRNYSVTHDTMELD
tara:strand:+ start:1691 stop:1894 length:204 start_codon:yes stop_codon:yes gene_type:complete